MGCTSGDEESAHCEERDVGIDIWDGEERYEKEVGSWI
jgi:hypothetical protein